MAVSIIPQNTPRIMMRKITIKYSCPGSTNSTASFSAAVNNDLPAGYSYYGVVGFEAVGAASVLTSAIKVEDRSIVVRNISNTSISNASYNIWYLAIKQ